MVSFVARVRVSGCFTAFYGKVRPRHFGFLETPKPLIKERTLNYNKSPITI